MTPKAQKTKEKIDKIDMIKIKNLHFKEHHQKMKTTQGMGENTCKSCIS